MQTKLHRYIVETRPVQLGNLRDNTRCHTLGVKATYDTHASSLKAAAKEIEADLAQGTVLVSVTDFKGRKLSLNEGFFGEDAFSAMFLCPPR